ncbi:MAG TPA: zinc ribbon domain-containing protein [Candidatus Ozemobacteraceae bacterium]|nr:zinc ribbon domain-containing protein [Candidatus Ozemobacteraceae bacterium]
MRKLAFLLVAGLLIALPAFAVFCTTCGEKLPDSARFCSKCGGKITAPTPEKKTTPAVKEKPAAVEPAPTTEPAPAASAPSLAGTFRLKTDLYVYAKRGDEHNVLKKNLFFKPRRDRIKANAEIKILEVVGDAYLVEQVAPVNGKGLKGWCTESELALRSTWTK